MLPPGQYILSEKIIFTNTKILFNFLHLPVVLAAPLSDIGLTSLLHSLQLFTHYFVVENIKLFGNVSKILFLN
jgi:hypothetical protein